MKNQEKIKFDNALYQSGLYDAYCFNHESPIEIVSIKNNMALGWVDNTAYHCSIDDVRLVKRPRKVWVHIIESPDGSLTSRLTDYQDVITYKGNTIVKQIEVEV